MEYNSNNMYNVNIPVYICTFHLNFMFIKQILKKIITPQKY